MEFKPNLSPEQLTDYFRQAKMEAAGKVMNAYLNLRAAQAAEKAIEDEETRLLGKRIPPDKEPFRGNGGPSPVAPIADETEDDGRPIPVAAGHSGRKR